MPQPPDEPTELDLQEYEDDNADWEYEDGPSDRD